MSRLTFGVERKNTIESNSLVVRGMEKRNPLVSVIVPIYNVQDYLEECVESIIDQTYQNLEIILVDDGATDNSGALCDEFQDSRVKVIHQKNRGLAGARNTGLDIARGEYIAFVDSDDVLGVTMIESLIKGMRKTGTLIGCCSFTRKQSQLYKKVAIQRETINQKEAISRLFDDKGYRFFAWNKLFHRSLFEKVRFPEGELYEDIKPIYSVFKKIDKICYVSNKLYYYRKREGSITDGFTKRSYDRIIALNTIIRDCKYFDYTIYQNIIPKYAAHYLYFFNGVYRNGVNLSKKENWLRGSIQKYRKRIILAEGLSIATKICLLAYGAKINLYKPVYMAYVKIKNFIRTF